MGAARNFTVNAAAAYGLSLSAESLNPSAGESDELTIAAIDQFGNTATSYTGSKSLTFGGAATIGALPGSARGHVSPVPRPGTLPPVSGRH